MKVLALITAVLCVPHYVSAQLHFCDDHAEQEGEDVDLDEVCDENNSEVACNTSSYENPVCAVPNSIGDECVVEWGARQCSPSEKSISGFGDGCRVVWVKCVGHSSGSEGATCFGDIDAERLEAGEFVTSSIGASCRDISRVWRHYECEAMF